MTHVRSVVRSSMHPCPGNWVQSSVLLYIMSDLPVHLVQELNICTVGVSICYSKECHQYTISTRMFESNR